MKVFHGLAALTALVLMAPANAGVTGPRFVGGVDGALLPVTVGSVVAQGVARGDGSCHFPGTTAFGAEGLTSTMHITTLVTPGCAMVVDAIGPVTEPAANEEPSSVGAGLGANVLIEADTAGLATGHLAEPGTKVPRKGETEFTILEQFGITAFELHIELSANQDTRTGEISDGTATGYCYASAFPDNEIDACFGNYPSRGGDYAEVQAWGKFENPATNVSMYLHTVHIITRSNSGGRCELIEGAYPIFWRGDCKVVRHR